MNSDLKQLLFYVGLILAFGGFQALLNIMLVSWMLLGIIALILVTFFKKDLIIMGLRILYSIISKKSRFAH